MNIQDLKGEEYPPYYQKYIDQLPQEDLLNIINRQKEEMINFLDKLLEEDLAKTYAPGKWTVAQVLQHLFDTERIFQYRALRISRQDKTPLPGYDQDAYVPASFANQRNKKELLEEYRTIRDAGISLFKSFSSAMLKERGHSSGGTLSVAAAGFIIAGHEKHHLKLFQSLYKL
ncbi:MAG TPA: DinB family protein [Gillisia sp.]|nr:DinB family protein [Gillisia sp.]